LPDTDGNGLARLARRKGKEAMYSFGVKSGSVG